MCLCQSHGWLCVSDLSDHLKGYLGEHHIPVRLFPLSFKVLRLFRSAQLAGNVPAALAHTVSQDAHDSYMPLVNKARSLLLAALRLQLYIKSMQPLAQQQTCEIVV